MKDKIIIVSISLSFVLLLAFFVFNNGITGFVSEADEDLVNLSEGNQSGAIFLTEQSALEIINQSEEIIKEMKENGFSIIYMNDILADAKKVFEQAGYAEILRNEKNVSEEEKRRAGAALSLVADWRNIDYTSILPYTDKIKARKEQAFVIYDSITTLNESINQYKKEGIDISDTEKLLERVNIAFYEDRYEDCEDYLIELRNFIETKKTQTTIFAQLGKGGKTFMQKYWFYLLFFLIALSVGGFFSYKKIKKIILRKKIIQLRVQEKVLIDLMKKVQVERFEKNKISGLIYNIKMKNYQGKLNEIKEKLPVLESMLK